MNILDTFVIRFLTNAADADKDMGKTEATAERLNDAMKSAAASTTEAAAATKALGAASNTAADGSLEVATATESIRSRILKDALEIAEAERNLGQFLLGNEAIHERTLDLLGGQQGLTDRIANETKAVAQGLIRAEREAEKLTDELGDADREAKDLQSSILSIAKGIAGPLLGVLSIGAALGAVKGRVEAVSNLIERASKARVDVSAYDQWRRAIIAAGGSAETAESQFEAFAQKMGEAFGDAETDAGKALAGLGVSAKDAQGNIKPTEAALLDLADSMKGVSKQTAVDSLRRLGIVDPLMVDMILQGRDALEGMLEAQRKNGALTQEQARRFKEFRTTLNDTSAAWTGMVDTMISAVLPTVTKVFEALRSGVGWLTENRTLVQGFGIALAGALTVAAGVALAIYAPAMWAAAAATLAATWPILAIIVAVAALAAAFALAYEDVKAFLSGQPSLIGELVNKYEWVRKAVELIGQAFQLAMRFSRALWDAVIGGAKALWPVLAATGRAIGMAFNALGSVLRGLKSIAGPVLGLIVDSLGLIGDVARLVARVVGSVFRALFSGMVGNAAPAFGKIGGFLQGLQAVFSSVAGVVRAVWGALFGWLGERLGAVFSRARGVINFARAAINRRGGPDDGPGGVGSAQRQVRAADRAPTNATTQTAAANRRPVNRSNTTTIQKVEVNTQATDAKGIAAAVGPALSSEVAKAQQDNDDGISI